MTSKVTRSTDHYSLLLKTERTKEVGRCFATTEIKQIAGEKVAIFDTFILDPYSERFAQP